MVPIDLSYQNKETTLSTLDPYMVTLNPKPLNPKPCMVT